MAGENFWRAIVLQAVKARLASRFRPGSKGTVESAASAATCTRRPERPASRCRLPSTKVQERRAAPEPGAIVAMQLRTPG